MCLATRIRQAAANAAATAAESLQLQLTAYDLNLRNPSLTLNPNAAAVVSSAPTSHAQSSAAQSVVPPPQQPQPQQQHTGASSSYSSVSGGTIATSVASDGSHSFPPTAIGPYVTYPNDGSGDLSRPLPGPQFAGRSGASHYAGGSSAAEAGSVSSLQPLTSASGSTAPSLPPHLYVPTASTSMSSSAGYPPYAPWGRNAIAAGGSGAGASAAAGNLLIEYYLPKWTREVNTGVNTQIILHSFSRRER